MYHIPMFIIPLLVWWILQVLKVIIDYLSWEKLNLERFFAAWWFPSVHSWLSTSVLVTIWYTDWIYSPVFAVTLIFSILFWYDAANVRYQAWKHAQIINRMRNQLSDILSPTICNTLWEKLKERLWHTFTEVIWWILISAGITYITIYFLNFYWIMIK